MVWSLGVDWDQENTITRLDVRWTNKKVNWGMLDSGNIKNKIRDYFVLHAALFLSALANENLRV